ncbi:MAG: YkgJ family cysteine cluster protein [Candidatus Methanoperedens sp.]|nr:YkgJ family cysteine cluster protein [Candidatus Methanoperedens sp.]
MQQPNRNDPCPCGSGKKYKKCCLDKENQRKAEMQTRFNLEFLKGEPKLIKLLDIYVKIASFFKCSKCGKCCRENPPDLLSDEYQHFDDKLTVWEDGFVALKKPCPFLVDNTCKIHDHKPRMCRFVPFQLGEQTDPIVIDDCELGKEILEMYFLFLEETDLGENDSIEDIMYPLAKLQRAKVFLNWLEKEKITLGFT